MVLGMGEECEREEGVFVEVRCRILNFFSGVWGRGWEGQMNRVRIHRERHRVQNERRNILAAWSRGLFTPQ